MRVAPVIQLAPNDRTALERFARGRRVPVRLALRARIVLLAAGGLENREIAAELKVSKPTVGLWRARYAKLGLAGIEKDATRPGRPRKDRQELEQKIVHMTTQEKPRNATHWSTRTLAAVLKIHHVLVHRVWKAHGLLPHRVRAFKLSKDKNFALFEPAGARARPLRRRKITDSSPRPHSTGSSDQEGPLRNHDSRLQAVWDNHTLRRAGHARRPRD